MDAWAKLDDLRGTVAAWKVIDINTADVATVAGAVAVIQKSGFDPARLTIFGWEVLLSRRRQDGVIFWHLSLQRYPATRQPTRDDEQVIAKIAARVGAPVTPALRAENPAAPIHWSWIETTAST